MKKYIWKQKYSIIVSVFLTLLCSLLSIMLIWIIQTLVDSMIEGNSRLLYEMIFILVLLVMTNFIFGFLSVLQEARISKKLHLDLKKDIFYAMLRQTHNEFKSTSIGSKLSIFENDINFVEEYYFNNIFTMMRNMIVLIVAVVYLFSKYKNRNSTHSLYSNCVNSSITIRKKY